MLAVTGGGGLSSALRCSPSYRALLFQFNIQGYPTIKYWKDGDEKDYQGGRDLDSLKTFVADNLATQCSVEDAPKGEKESGCTDKEIKYIEKMKSKKEAAEGEEEGEALIKKEYDRLSKMTGESMKADLMKWLNQRLKILKQMHKSSDAAAAEEL